MKVERLASIVKFVKRSIPLTLTSCKTTSNGNGRESVNRGNKSCKCRLYCHSISSNSYNMRPQDFLTEEDYNAYLEAREDMSNNRSIFKFKIIVQDFVEGRNLEDIKRKID